MPCIEFIWKAFPVENKEVLEEIEVAARGKLQWLVEKEVMTMEIITIIILTATLIAVSIIIQRRELKETGKWKITVKNEKIITDDFDDENYIVLQFEHRSICRHRLHTDVLRRQRYLTTASSRFQSIRKRRWDGWISTQNVCDISGLLSSNFLGTTVVQPDEEMAYSYCSDASPDELRLTVRENEDIDITLKPDFG